MPEINLDAGKALLKDKDGNLQVSIDPKDENLSLSDDGLYCNPFIRLDGDQYVDEWTVLTTDNMKKFYDDTKNADGVTLSDSGRKARGTGNARIISKCYALSMFKVTRARLGSSGGTWVLTTADPTLITDDNVESYRKELKNGADIKREMNFSRFYAYDPDHKDKEQGSPFVPRPGALLMSTDIACGTTSGTQAIYESGHRYSSHRGYRLTGTSGTGYTETNVPQVVYAMHILKEVTYGDSAGNIKVTELDEDYDNDSDGRITFKTKWHQYSGWYTIKQMVWQCIWSNQEAFHGLLNTNGWRPGEYLIAGSTYSPVFGRYKILS